MVPPCASMTCSRLVISLGNPGRRTLLTEAGGVCRCGWSGFRPGLRRVDKIDSYLSGLALYTVELRVGRASLRGTSAVPAGYTKSSVGLDIMN